MPRRWSIAILLFFSTLLNYFDRQIFSLVSPKLRLEFALSAQEYSHLLSAFLIGYTVMQLIAGLAVDRMGAKRGLLLAMGWWSIAGACLAFARNGWQLAVFLLLMGIGEAANWPTSVKAVREWFEPEQRAIAVGVFNAGSSAGAVIAPIIVAALALRYSWRTPFLVCGVLGVIWMAIWKFAYRTPATITDPEEALTTFSCLFLRDPRAWGVIIARLFADPIWLFYVFWLPDYLSHAQGLSLLQIGQIAWIPFAAAAVGNFAGGAASGLLVTRHASPVRARLVVMGLSAIIMCLGFVVRYCHTPALAIAVISVVVFAYSAWAANVLTLPGDMFPSRMVASVSGASGMAGGLGGLLITLLTGYLVDHASYAPVFAVLASLPLIAMLGALLTVKHRAVVDE